MLAPWSTQPVSPSGVVPMLPIARSVPAKVQGYPRGPVFSTKREAKASLFLCIFQSFGPEPFPRREIHHRSNTGHSNPNTNPMQINIAIGSQLIREPNKEKTKPTTNKGWHPQPAPPHPKRQPKRRNSNDTNHTKDHEIEKQKHDKTPKTIWFMELFVRNEKRHQRSNRKRQSSSFCVHC